MLPGQERAAEGVPVPCVGHGLLQYGGGQFGDPYGERDPLVQPVPHQDEQSTGSGREDGLHPARSAGMKVSGIRQRVRLRKPQWVAPHSWAFAQLGDFIVYKAKRAGVPLVLVDPAYTSQTCAECGHVDKRNRVDQGLFICRGCGVVAHADRNASHNIATRGETVWNAGRESRVPATPQGCLDGGANPAASWALPPNPVLQGRVKLT